MAEPLSCLARGNACKFWQRAFADLYTPPRPASRPYTAPPCVTLLPPCRLLTMACFDTEQEPSPLLCVCCLGVRLHPWLMLHLWLFVEAAHARRMSCVIQDVLGATPEARQCQRVISWHVSLVRSVTQIPCGVSARGAACGVRQGAFAAPFRHPMASVCRSWCGTAAISSKHTPAGISYCCCCCCFAAVPLQKPAGIFSCCCLPA